MDITSVNRAPVTSEAYTPRAAGPERRSELPPESTVREVKDVVATSADAKQRQAPVQTRKEYDSGYTSIDDTLVFQVKDQERVVDQFPNDQALALRRAIEAQDKAREQKAQDNSASVVA